MDSSRKLTKNEGRKAEPAQTEGASPDILQDAVPQRIGRYEVRRVLGTGGFGRVFLALDSNLERDVAIKVPFRRRLGRTEEASQYLAEARAVARLDHSAIVPVYDFGHMDDGTCFVVTKFVDGNDLAQHLHHHRPDLSESAELIAEIAEALHHAHTRGIFHRDIKPGNILIDRNGSPFLTDFGLALGENEYEAPTFAGTPAYMSPEQARGEGHRVDGRTDIYSLGIVFYELLTGSRPFEGGSQEELVRRIATTDVRPPRQRNDRIPRELERICLRALARQTRARYTTAMDMAEDLRHYLSSTSNLEPIAAAPDDRVSRSTAVDAATPITSAESSERRSSAPITVVPKGLRAFDANDADFFLQLLPGPRDRQGLPESLRFWKQRIESYSPDDSFSVGLLYGPSGCGKSSMVRAGLLPRIDDRIIQVYLEASATDTESRLTAAIHQSCPTLDVKGDLTRVLSRLRRSLRAGQEKVVLVIDQFEQWLQHHPDVTDSGLVTALRQCDAGRVQCLLMVRDDFWMAATRFMRALDLPLAEGVNSLATDLFTRRHSRRVLTAFGRAYGALPEFPQELDEKQREFIDRAIAELSEDEHVTPVRLVLLAEMLKGRPWHPETIESMGGSTGIGESFLMQAFSSNSSPPENRLHEAGIRRVLEQLLPDDSTNLKGHRRTESELKAAAGYSKRSAAFAELIRILDRHTRLITPVDPADTTIELQGEPSYQLAHDYLIPSLRQWLTRRQRESRHGRAELLLAERTRLWSARREHRQLPSIWEWMSIRCLTAGRHWSDAERAMIRAANRRHVARFSIALVVLAVGLGVTSLAVRRIQARAVIDRLTTADTSAVTQLLGELPGLPVHEPLKVELTRAAPGSRHELHVRLGLLAIGDSSQLPSLVDHLAMATPIESQVIRNGLSPLRGESLPRIWSLADNSMGQQQPVPLGVASALAQFAPTDPRWKTAAPAVVEALLAEDYLTIESWISLVEPSKPWLIEPLTRIYRGQETVPSFSSNRATELLVTLVGSDVRGLAELAGFATVEQFPVVFRRLRVLGEPARQAMKAHWVDIGSSTATALDALSVRTNVAVTMFRLGDEQVALDGLATNDPPAARAQLIQSLALLGADPMRVIANVHDEPRPLVRQGLLMAAGQCSVERVAPTDRSQALAVLLEALQADPDPGVHSAVRWLLKQWEAEPSAETILTNLTGKPIDGSRGWYVTSEHHHMAVISPGASFVMGSAETEPRRLDRDFELQHERIIDRGFAVSCEEISVAQFQRFLVSEQLNTARLNESYAPDPTCPRNSVTWYEAAQYCNWLSRQEGFDECYEPNSAGRYAAGMRLHPNFLDLNGYRLPSESEWEYVCRAGTADMRAYGIVELAGAYDWHVMNSSERTWPVGSKLPNALGMFDMYGNVIEWCHDEFQPYRADTQPNETGSQDIEAAVSRSLRGGSFLSPPLGFRSAVRNSRAPGTQSGQIGFRIARTIHPP